MIQSNLCLRVRVTIASEPEIVVRKVYEAIGSVAIPDPVKDVE